MGSQHFDIHDPHVTTVTGGKMYLLRPRVDDVSLEDIAYSLARIVRWNGHIRDAEKQRPLSVAEHAMRVAHRLSFNGAPPMLELAGVLHDAHEAYLGDITTPVSYAIGADRIQSLKLSLDVAIRKAFDLPEYLPYNWQIAIKAADNAEMERESDSRFEGRDYLAPGLAEELFTQKVQELSESWPA